ncbi:MAG: hypothetical protein ACLFPU_06465 [Dehalococcoidia bacterium]
MQSETIKAPAITPPRTYCLLEPGKRQYYPTNAPEWEWSKIAAAVLEVTLRDCAEAYEAYGNIVEAMRSRSSQRLVDSGVSIMYETLSKPVRLISPIEVSRKWVSALNHADLNYAIETMEYFLREFFNSEDNKADGAIKVDPRCDNTVLLWNALIFRAFCESQDITQAELSQNFLGDELHGTTFKGQPSTRLNRQQKRTLTKMAKKRIGPAILHHDDVYMLFNTIESPNGDDLRPAELWRAARVTHPSLTEAASAFKMDPKKLQDTVSPVDDAVGYPKKR